MYPQMTWKAKFKFRNLRLLGMLCWNEASQEEESHPPIPRSPSTVFPPTLSSSPHHSVSIYMPRMPTPWPSISPQVQDQTCEPEAWALADPGSMLGAVWAGISRILGFQGEV